MTTTSPPAETTAVSPTAKALWRRGRGALVAAAVLAVTGIVLAFLQDSPSGPLDPRSASPTGSRAIAELLADRGVDTRVVTSAAEAADAAGPDTTLLVAHPDSLGDAALATLRDATAGRTVLLAPTAVSLPALAPDVTVTPSSSAASTLSPDCGYEPARRAGTATLGGVGYTAGPDTDPSVGCYPFVGAPTLLVISHATSDTILLGTPEALRNDHLADEGNAALALQLLGAHPDLVWYLPSGGEAAAAGGDETFTDLIHPGWRWAALQLGIAAALAALWRARRLGPVVTEPLPVVVHAAETTEGRARLYHRTGARDRAADALRTAARGRLAPLVGLPRPAADGVVELTEAVAAHTGDPAPAVHHLLFGPPPADDTGLIRLADDLDALERRVAPDHAHPRSKDRPQ
ncbi:DUF4350 domain-containing protein [Streptomyces avicenniae]|uniref:DUF4350 domain-containing protein n=1 Tax=Streptomyces avicenniae TaxID=500153 RepID=UPI00069BFF20|nr:DUF4350 domain-containing protein [Streptomyces avicenniae]